MADCAVRRATLTDVQVLAKLFDDYRQFYEQPSDVERCQTFLSDRIVFNQSIIFLASSSSGEALGFCQLYPSFCSVLAKPIYVLYDLFVSNMHRRKGLSRALMRIAQEFAMREGAARMDLTTAHTNLAAQALYEAMGWQQDKVFRTYTWTPVVGA